MKAIIWLVRVLLFVVFFAFALFNTNPITLNYLIGVWTAPLALVLLVAFAAGALFGLAVVFPTLYRQRNHVRRLQRDVSLPPSS